MSIQNVSEAHEQTDEDTRGVASWPTRRAGAPRELPVHATMPKLRSPGGGARQLGQAPLLMTFPSGLPLPHQLEALSVAAPEDGALFAETEAVHYTGAAVDENAAGTLLVGVREPGSNTVQLFKPSTLYAMAPALKQPAVSLQPIALVTPQKRDLTSELGSEKSRKRLRAAAATRVDADAVYNAGGLAEDMERVAAAAVADPALDEDAAARPHLPPHDTRALDARGAYPRDGLVPPALWAKLDVAPLVAAAKDTALAAAGVWPPLVLGRLRALGGGATREELGVSTYLAHFLRFAGMKREPTLVVEKGGESEVWNHLVRTYSDEVPALAPGDRKNRRRVGDTKRQALLTRALALALWLGNGKLAVAEVTTALQLPAQGKWSCAFYLKQLGCTITGANSKEGAVAQLKLPLAFPRVARGGRGAGGK